MVHKAYSEPLALDTGIPPEQFKSLLVADHYILLRQARNCHPAVVDMNTLATYLQPEIKSILDSVHPFLVHPFSCFTLTLSHLLSRQRMKLTFPKTVI